MGERRLPQKSIDYVKADLRCRVRRFNRRYRAWQSTLQGLAGQGWDMPGVNCPDTVLYDVASVVWLTAGCYCPRSWRLCNLEA